MINNLANALGGAHGAFRRTSDLLSRHGIEVRQFTLDDVRPARLQKDLGPGDVLPYLSNGDAAKQIREVLNDFRPDLAHVHLFIGGLSVSIIQELFRAGIPIIHTVHDYRLICPANAMLNAAGEICERCKISLLNCVVQRCAHGSIAKSAVATAEAVVRRVGAVNSRIEKYIFVSEFCKNKHAEFNRIFGERGVVVPNFLADPNFEEVPAAKRNGIVFFGRLSGEKGLSNLLAAVRKSDVQLTIVGDGPLQPVVKDAAAAHANVTYLGQLDFSELKAVIAHSRFSVVPSVWYENNPLSVVEAMALGTPVIASNIGGLPEMVKPNFNGYLFDHDSIDNLALVMEQAMAIPSAEWARLSCGALQFFDANYSESVFLERLVAEYSSVLGGPVTTSMRAL
jgi:glycosyltransferase involved in cell wall biosynthesis